MARVKDQQLRAILERYGYDPDDPMPRDDEGERIIPDKLLFRLARTSLAEAEHLVAKGELSEKELEVVALLACGLSRAKIAAKQGVTLETIKTQLRHIYDKLEANNAAHAVTIAIARRLIPRGGEKS
jgi:DNA-binding NarL/FixJ family response regulator